eukprot:m.189833 g.189833  ORF g.189833 m.189833 type:complete len:620 (+) comp14801_c0_seq1:331-2190(+)
MDRAPYFQLQCVVAIVVCTLACFNGVTHGRAQAKLPVSAMPSIPFTPTRAQSTALAHLAADNLAILVMVNADCATTRAMAATTVKTWMQLPGASQVSVKFMVGDSANGTTSCAGDETIDRTLVEYVPQCHDGYPPVDKVLCMWEHARKHWVKQYQFFIKIDMDTYLNLPNLAVFLMAQNRIKPLYAGRVGKGRNNEFDPYCMGFFYVLNQRALAQIPEDFVSKARPAVNSDVAFSLVVTDHVQLPCMQGVSSRYQYSFVNRYWDFNDGIVQSYLDEQQRSILPVFHPATSHQLAAVAVHPYKTPSDMHRFHDAVLYSRVKLFQFSKPSKSQSLPDYLRSLCVYNPSMQFEVSGLIMKECDLERPNHPRKLHHAFILFMKTSPTSRTRAAELAQHTRLDNVKNTLYPVVDAHHLFGMLRHHINLTMGHLGLRETYRVLLHQLISSTDFGDELFLVLHDNVQVTDMFSARIAELMQDRRCGAFLSSNSGGALLLSVTIPRNGSFPSLSSDTGGWLLADNDPGTKGAAPCFNYNSGVQDVFAFILDRRAALVLLTWLNDPQFADKPFDHAWQYLSIQGVPVRVAFPFVAMPSLVAPNESSHPSASQWNQQSAQVPSWTRQPT